MFTHRFLTQSILILKDASFALLPRCSCNSAPACDGTEPGTLRKTGSCRVLLMLVYYNQAAVDKAKLSL